jgi:transmembrane sensor
MTEGHDTVGKGRVAEEAARWFARLQDQAAGGDEWLAFEGWLRASPARVEAYARLERLWVELDDQAAAIEANLNHARTAPPRSAGPIRFSRRAWLAGGGGLAASVAIGTVAVLNWPEPLRQAVLYRTALGETRQITLSDGTRIHLNAGSQMRVSFTPDARRVELGDAEAAFDVAHDPKRPFLIAVGDRQVKVVGTEFNLRRRSGAIQLTVRRGVVEVRPAGTPQGPPLRVAIGQQLTHKEGDTAPTLAAADPDAAFAWTTGQLVYRDQPLSDVAADLTRRFGRPVRVADPQTGALRFSGVLVTDSQPAVLRRLQSFVPVSVERTDGAIILRRRTGPS